jgi:hypothetical protein
MSPLDAYLAKHFLAAKDFAAVCQVEPDELFDWIAKQLVPAAAYVVSDSTTVSSYVFGKMPTPRSTDGHYFHPGNAIWIQKARKAIAEFGPERAAHELKLQFHANFHVALAELDASTWRLHDSFAPDGAPIAIGLQARIDHIWEHFLRGTFGLCVANPGSESAIARKEVLQEKLVALSQNGTKVEFPPAEAQDMLTLIDAYAQSAMPFSPIEYPISSRKRLVEDLRDKILAVQRRQQPRS